MYSFLNELLSLGVYIAYVKRFKLSNVVFNASNQNVNFWELIGSKVDCPQSLADVLKIEEASIIKA